MSKLIFFVDDDKMINNLLEYTFQSRDQYDVRTFTSGADCLASLNQQPDLIVLDHQLGEDKGNLTGMYFLEEIRKEKRDVPVIVLTAFATDNLLEKYINKGASRFLTKDDYFIDNLIETIGEVLN